MAGMQECLLRPNFSINITVSHFSQYVKHERRKRKRKSPVIGGIVVVPAGVEPAISWMRTRRPGPLDDETTGFSITQMRVLLKSWRRFSGGMGRNGCGDGAGWRWPR